MCRNCNKYTFRLPKENRCEKFVLMKNNAGWYINWEPTKEAIKEGYRRIEIYEAKTIKEATNRCKKLLKESKVQIM